MISAYTCMRDSLNSFILHGVKKQINKNRKMLTGRVGTGFCLNHIILISGGEEAFEVLQEQVVSVHDRQSLLGFSVGRIRFCEVIDVLD